MRDEDVRYYLKQLEDVAKLFDEFTPGRSRQAKYSQWVLRPAEAQRPQLLSIYYYAFDLLNRNGELLVNLPLSRRREALESLLTAIVHARLHAPKGAYHAVLHDIFFRRCKSILAVGWYLTCYVDDLILAQCQLSIPHDVSSYKQPSIPSKGNNR